MDTYEKEEHNTSSEKRVTTKELMKNSISGRRGID
jgi:hypothetical protein